MIIFDLDGTLANCEHRRHFVDARYRDDCVLWIDDKAREHYLYKDGYERFETRKKFVPDWSAFYEACDQDVPIEPVIQLFDELAKKHGRNGLRIWSGRCESVSQKTLGWLAYHSKQFHEQGIFVKMRPIGDYTPDDVLKERWLDEIIAKGKTIYFVFDDRPKVIGMWRRRGIFVFNCCQHDNEF